MASDDYYPYAPSLIAAVIGVGLYFALFAVHLVRIYHTRAWDGTYMLAGALSKYWLTIIRDFPASADHFLNQQRRLWD